MEKQVKPVTSLGNVYVFDTADIQFADVRMNHTSRVRSLDDECLGICDKSLEQEIRRRRESYLPGTGMYDGILLCFESLERGEKTRVLNTCDINYSTYQTLKSRLERTPGHEHTITRTLPMIGIVETSDNHLVLGYRSTVHMPDRYLPPAGFTDHTDPLPKNYLADITHEEVLEETGVDINPNAVRYLGLTSGDDSRNVTFITYVRVPQTVQDVEIKFAEMDAKLSREGKTVEHLHLLYLPSGIGALSDFLSSEYTGVLNPNKNIQFENGICKIGPPEIRGKRYKQIGNGIGSMLCYIKTRTTDEQYQALVQRIEKSGAVDRILHPDINKHWSKTA